MDTKPAEPAGQDPLDNIILIGTAHVSEKSIRDVEEAIEQRKPDIVAVELDERRYRALMEGGEGKKEIQIKELLKGNNLAVFIIQLLLTYVQRKAGLGTGVKPGSEMVAAIDVAKKQGADIALIDRDIGVTLSRFWGKMSLWEKLKMMFSLAMASMGIGGGEAIDMDTITEESTVSGMIEELRHFTPSAATVLIDERDAYLAHNLLEIGKTRRVLGVVGAGHREGIMKYLKHPETIPPIETISVPSKKRHIPILKILGLLAVLIAVAVFGLLLLSGIPIEQLLIAVLILFIIKGILSALFVALVGGHKKSIATCFALAWYSLVNPIAHIGWFAGVVEAAERPPTMNDVNTILGKDEDSVIETFKNMYNNRLFKVILVAALANVGSFLGTLCGVAVIVYYLHITDPVGLLQAGSANGYHTVTSWLGGIL